MLFYKPKAILGTLSVVLLLSPIQTSQAGRIQSLWEWAIPQRDKGDKPVKKYYGGITIIDYNTPSYLEQKRKKRQESKKDKQDRRLDRQQHQINKLMSATYGQNYQPITGDTQVD